MGGAPAFPEHGRLSAIQQPPRLQLADRIEALTALKLGQIDAGLGMTPAHILWRSVIWRAALTPLSEWLLSSRYEPNGGKSQQIGRKKQARPGGRPHELRRVAADRVWELLRSATQGARG